MGLASRTALRIALAASAAGAVFGVNAGPLRAQFEMELTKQAKGRAKAFAWVRTEWGLKPAGPSETEVQPAVGDELTDGLHSFDEVIAALTTRLRRPMRLIDLSGYGREERMRRKNAMLGAERRVRRTVDALARHELDSSQARAEVRQIFADYLEELEAAPRR